MTTRNWMHDLLAAVDRGGVRGMYDRLDENVTFRFGSFPAAQGRETFAAAWEAMSGDIASMSHTLLQSWQFDQTAICRGDVTYRLRNGTSVTVPFCNVFELRDDLIHGYYIYVDASAVFGPAGAPETS